MLHRNLARRCVRSARGDIDRRPDWALHLGSNTVVVVSTTISPSPDPGPDAGPHPGQSLVAALAAALDRIERAADTRTEQAAVAHAEARAADAREIARLRRIENAAAAALAELDAILDGKAA